MFLIRSKGNALLAAVALAAASCFLLTGTNDLTGHFNGMLAKRRMESSDFDRLMQDIFHARNNREAPAERLENANVKVVVSHCKKSLDWIPDYIRPFRHIETIEIYSKCGVEVHWPS